MVKVSERQELLGNLETVMKLSSIVDCVDDSSCSSDVEGDTSSEEDIDTVYGVASCLHFMISQQRYLSDRRKIVERTQDYVLNYFLNQAEVDFRVITRVNRPTFFYILRKIEQDPVFHNHSRNPQHPVHWQLACALDRLGNDGQGVSHARSKFIWGIGTGTVHLYTRRVVQALCRLKGQFIQWPDYVARQTISHRLSMVGFKNAVGFVDGTTIPLHKKPAMHGNVFMDKKKRYSVNAQVACDDMYRIIYFMVGHPGSAGDSRVYSASSLSKHPERAFSPGQYLLADSGYVATTTVVPAYKDNQRDDRDDSDEPQKIEKFNTLLAKARVVNEHTIGILKGRWSSLRGMQIDINEKQHMRTFVEQATACVVLHNMCVKKDPWDMEFQEASNMDERQANIEAVVGHAVLSAGQQKRWAVRKACLAFHGIDAFM